LVFDFGVAPKRLEKTRRARTKLLIFRKGERLVKVTQEALEKKLDATMKNEYFPRRQRCRS